jgi:catechol 2,3-dioxygenase-like lactoylglutathione lyase family enzyme
MRHLALAVRDQERSRRFYETYFGLGAKPARRYDGLKCRDPEGYKRNDNYCRRLRVVLVPRIVTTHS